MRNVTTLIELGNREVSLTVNGSTFWNRGNNTRTYFEITASDRRNNPFSAFYEVVEGSIRDNTIEVGGRTFAYEANCLANSKTKRAAVAYAAEELARQIVEADLEDDIFTEDQIILLA